MKYPGEANVNLLLITSGSTLDISAIVTDITWSGDIMQASRKLEVKCVNTTDGKTQAKKLSVGMQLRFLSDNVEKFRGIIFATSINAAGEMSLTAYDENTYLTRNADSFIFRKKKASEIVKELCSKFQIPVGKIEDTGFVIPKQISKNMILWDVMITALTTTRKNNGRKFVLTAIDGKLNLLERKSRIIKWVLEQGVNTTDVSYSQSIEDMRNQVKVVANEDDEKKKPITAIEKDSASITKYGLMQHFESASGDLTSAGVKAMAKQLLKELNVVNDEATLSGIGNDEVVAGASIYAFDKMTGVQGGFYILTDSHTYSGGLHTMSLTLSATDELPTMEYTEPEDADAKKDKAKTSKGTSANKTNKDGSKSTTESQKTTLANGDRQKITKTTTTDKNGNKVTKTTTTITDPNGNSKSNTITTKG